MALLLVLGLCTLLFISVIDLASLHTGLTNFKKLLFDVLSQFVHNFYTSKLSEFSTLFYNCLFAIKVFFSATGLSYSASIYTLFFDLSHGFSLPIGWWKGFAGAGIRLFTSNLLFYFDLLTTGLLAIGAHTKKCFMISIYPIKILFQVLYISDLDCFSNGMCILTLLPNIWKYERSYLTLAQAYSGMMITLFIRLVGNWFCK